MAARFGRERGGICWLVDLIDERRAAVTYDWHARFGQPIAAIGTASMPWPEAVDLAQIIHADPSSAVAAAALGWDYPMSREALILLDTFDLQHAANSSKRPKPHPMRPKSQSKRTNRYGNTGGRSVEQVKELLRRRYEGAV